MSASSAPARCSQGDAVASGYGGVGGVAVDLACAARGDEDGAGGNAPRFAGMGFGSALIRFAATTRLSSTIKSVAIVHSAN